MFDEKELRLFAATIHAMPPGIHEGGDLYLAYREATDTPAARHIGPYRSYRILAHLGYPQCRVGSRIAFHIDKPRPVTDELLRAYCHE